MIKTVRTAIATALLLAAGNAAALGLGQIEVKSRLNQPLLAEIPIISTVPGELEALQARMASPETFRRIGLPAPSGVAADLQFSLGSDSRGRPVIRVTTTAPVNQAVLNFLIEVDWGQGRLVREYSALVDAPRTATAPVQPAISAPVVAAPNVVQRPAPVTAAPVAVPTPPPPAVSALPPPAPVRAPVPVPAPEPEPAPVTAAIEPLPQPTAVTAAPAPVAVRATPAAPPAPRPAAEQYGPVKRGESLSKIASQLPLPLGYTLDQAMLALLRANPDAFLGGDINQLKQGAVLRVPGSTELGGVSADEAALVVREQMREWREARRPVVQPEAPPAPPRPVDAAAAAVPPPASRAPTPPVAPATRQATAQARLQIVPPSAPGQATGTRSGTSAGGEGTMLQQQLRQRDEDLAARTAEIGELKERVAELEKLQQQQQQLLTMKDSELAAAQQRLADARTAQPASVAGATTLQSQAPAPGQGTTQPSPPAEPAASSSAAPLLWGSLVLLGVALLAWLLMSRRRRQAQPPRRKFDSEALAASMPAPLVEERSGGSTADGPGPEQPDTATDPDERRDAADAHPAPAIPPASVAGADAPAWHSGRWFKAPPAAEPMVDPSAPSFAQAEAAGDPPAKASPSQRLKLALAFRDIGDDQSAQQLLTELLDDADPAARIEAARLLRELG